MAVQRIGRAIATRVRHPSKLLTPSGRLAVHLRMAKTRMKVVEIARWGARIETDGLQRVDPELDAIVQRTTAREYQPTTTGHRPGSETDPGGWDQSPNAARQRDRLHMAAELFLQRYPGDIAEIGAYRGLTTARFAAAAREYGRRVLVVDPWNAGETLADGIAYNVDYDEFRRTIEPFADVVDVVRMSSLSDGAKAELRARTLAFAYVDGLHTFAAALSDIHAVQHSAVIAVDDTHWAADYPYGGQLRLAVARAARQTGRVAFQLPSTRESYLFQPGHLAHAHARS